MATFHELTTAQLRQALQLREQIETYQQKLDTLLGGASVPAPKAKGSAPSKKRTMSAAGRAKIAAAQKARWAKTKDTPAKAPAKAVAKKKSVFSAERRAKLAASMKARWAARKKAGTGSGATSA